MIMDHLQQAFLVSLSVNLSSHSLNLVHFNMCATTVGEGVHLGMLIPPISGKPQLHYMSKQCVHCT